ncbi:MAG: hypothetical protein ACRCTE_13490 [Cellulosilyticaceae bacterium]
MLYDTITKLKLMKCASIIIILIAAAFVGFGEHYIIAIIFIIIDLALSALFYKCPHCNKSLDMRLALNESTHCPYCGKVIAHIHNG